MLELAVELESPLMIDQLFLLQFDRNLADRRAFVQAHHHRGIVLHQTEHIVGNRNGQRRQGKGNTDDEEDVGQERQTAGAALLLFLFGFFVCGCIVMLGFVIRHINTLSVLDFILNTAKTGDAEIIFSFLPVKLLLFTDMLFSL